MIDPGCPDLFSRRDRPILAGWGVAIVASLLSLVIAGCESGEDSDKRSYHEVDHTTPEHWPDDPTDLAAKIMRRVETVREGGEAGEEAGRELSDLVSWTSEVAADSDLTESEWNPIHDAAESLSKRLSSDRGKWSEAKLDLASDLAERVAETLSRSVAFGRQAEGELGVEFGDTTAGGPANDGAGVEPAGIDLAGDGNDG